MNRLKLLFADARARAVGRLARMRPGSLLILGYLVYTLFGTVLLALPVSRASDAGSWIDLVFVAMSAVSTTGLSTLSTGNDFTGFGQAVILLLVQLGGLGYMVAGSFIVLAVAGTVSPRRQDIVRSALSLPSTFEVVPLLRLIVGYTIALEIAGSALLALRFAHLGVPDPVWQGSFHAVSAFCTAGFGLSDTSLEAFRADRVVNGIIIALSYAGAIGFLVVNDLAATITRRRLHLTFTSRIILVGTVVVTALSMIGLLLEERWWSDQPLPDILLMAWFQAMSAFTTVGFNTVPMAELSKASVFLLFLCMLVGASPCGTGGGIKVTSLTACWALVRAVLRGNTTPCFLGREIPEARRRLAVATVLLYLGMLSLGIYALACFETAPLFSLVFECASALGTVGLSLGITSALSDAGKVVVIALMFVGRVGPLAMALVLLRGPETHELVDS